MKDLHTAGPWAAKANSVQAPHHARSFTTICYLLGGMKTSAELDANARLIAAAPDMLQALRLAVAAIAWAAERNSAFEKTYAAVDAAIATATRRISAC